jgi:hypothetical protein
MQVTGSLSNDKQTVEEKLLIHPETDKTNMPDHEIPVTKIETEINTPEQSKTEDTYTAAASDLLTKEEHLQYETEDPDLEFDLDLEDLETEDAAQYEVPEIESEAAFFAGYRFIGISGSERAFEYEHEGHYPSFGGDWVSFKYPHKYHFDLDVKNNKDYLSDFRYGYKTLVNFRLFNSTFYHNLDNIQLIDLNPSTLSPNIIINDRNRDYGLRTGINDLYLILKKADHPIHLYVKGFHVFKEGEQQQRTLLGSGFFNDLDRTTQRRNIDTETMTYTAGVNSHLGHVEADYSHSEKRFNVSTDEVLFDTYVSGSASRPPGIFPHNQLSELKSSSDKIKMHTNYSGRLAASMTLSRKHRENRASGANDDILLGEGAVRWTPLTRLSFFLKYSHRDLDADNPGTSSITDSSGVTTTYAGPVKPSVSSITDTVSLTGRYRPERGILLKAKYVYKNIDRNNIELWNLQDSTQKNTLILSADARVIKGLKINTSYTQRTIEKPSYNSEPAYSNNGTASISWLPSAKINLFATYSASRDRRDDLIFKETPLATDRDVERDNVLGSGTFQLRHNMSLTTSYAYMRYKIIQDIVYENLGGTELADFDVPMTENAHVVSATVHYMPKPELTLEAGINHTRVSGKFKPDSPDLVSPVSVTTFSELKVRETAYILNGTYSCFSSFTCALDMSYRVFNDVLDNIHDSEQDGDGYYVLVTLSKKWR